LLASTPRQLLLFALMGKKAPRYAHIPLLCDNGGERLAKRHKSLELCALRARGVPPAAITGFLAFMAGWLPKPEPARPADILPLFSLETLRGRELRLPQALPF
ncbi:tRNA glutamyl-Q(34) synthetase GluQRS, partial [Desulfovibrio sp. OttesenSCG-928-G15]|nr:tRNA glutamyl-Q(34) synthetase GluQRS [Desulfovibrio sp. OttesenSCG-928-G15]